MSTAEIVLSIVVVIQMVRNRNGWRNLIDYTRSTNNNILQLHKRIEKLEREAKR